MNLMPGDNKVKVLILGINGLIGSTLFRTLTNQKNIDCYGTFRTSTKSIFFRAAISKKKIFQCDALNFNSFITTIKNVNPDFIINCIGITKHHSLNTTKELFYDINAYFPKKLSSLCASQKIKLLHISTDCVYKGLKGNYSELDVTDSTDYYGSSKAEGEDLDPSTLVIRTSTIGHEIDSCFGLLNWFLAQENTCVGYDKAIFSGLPTVSLSQIICSIIQNDYNLQGLYNISSKPIDKYSLLAIISNVYGKDIKIFRDSSVVINRSLDGSKFKGTNIWSPVDWDLLVKSMYHDYNSSKDILNYENIK